MWNSVSCSPPRKGHELRDTLEYTLWNSVSCSPRPVRGMRYRIFWNMKGNEMKITLLTVGKVKEKFYVQAIGEFTKRLSRYCKLEILEVADEKTPVGGSGQAEEQIRQKEGERLLKHIRDDAYVISLEIGGKMLDSLEFSRKIEELGVQGTSHIIFLIGGSLGLGLNVLKRSDFSVSFSKMTFPHQLMRIILLEQIYRGYRIMAGEPYHK